MVAVAVLMPIHGTWGVKECLPPCKISGAAEASDAVRNRDLGAKERLPSGDGWLLLPNGTNSRVAAFPNGTNTSGSFSQPASCTTRVSNERDTQGRHPVTTSKR